MNSGWKPQLCDKGIFPLGLAGINERNRLITTVMPGLLLPFAKLIR